jgi:hypothetical protein
VLHLPHQEFAMHKYGHIRRGWPPQAFRKVYTRTTLTNATLTT